MSKGRHFALTKREKILLLIIAVYCVWRFLLSDSFINSVVALIFGGVVPGTSMVLSPVTLLASVAAVAALCAIGIVVKLILGRLRRKRSMQQHETPQYADITPTETTPPQSNDPNPQQAQTPKITPYQRYRPMVHIRTRRMQRNAQVAIPRITAPSVRLPHFDTQPAQHAAIRIATYSHKTTKRTMFSVVSTAHTAFNACARLSKATIRNSLRLLHLLGTTSIAGIARAISFAMHSMRVVRTHVVRAWVWAAPYIWRYDKWVETHMRNMATQTMRTVRTQIHKHENIIFVGNIIKEGLKLIRPRQLKSAWAGTKDRLVKPKNNT